MLNAKVGDNQIKFMQIHLCCHKIQKVQRVRNQELCFYKTRQAASGHRGQGRLIASI